MKGFVRIVQSVLVLVFLGSGSSKLVGTSEMIDDFDRYRYPQWFRIVTGAVEVSGAAGLLVAFFRPVVAPLAELLLGATMTGALASHAKVKDPAGKFVPPAVLLVLVAVVGARRQASKPAKDLQPRSKP